MYDFASTNKSVSFLGYLGLAGVLSIRPTRFRIRILFSGRLHGLGLAAC